MMRLRGVKEEKRRARGGKEEKERRRENSRGKLLVVAPSQRDGTRVKSRKRRMRW
jgi:hypothetical protein